MGLGKGPTEGGSGGKRGHSSMEHWGYTDEVKSAARMRRRIEDKESITEQLKPEIADSDEESETS